MFTSRFSICFFWVWLATFDEAPISLFKETTCPSRVAAVVAATLIKLSDEEFGVIEVDEVSELDDDVWILLGCWFSLENVIIDWKFRVGLD